MDEPRDQVAELSCAIDDNNGDTMKKIIEIPVEKMSPEVIKHMVHLASTTVKGLNNLDTLRKESSNLARIPQDHIPIISSCLGASSSDRFAIDLFILQIKSISDLIHINSTVTGSDKKTGNPPTLPGNPFLDIFQLYGYSDQLDCFDNVEMLRVEEAIKEMANFIKLLDRNFWNSCVKSLEDLKLLKTHFCPSILDSHEFFDIIVAALDIESLKSFIKFFANMKLLIECPDDWKSLKTALTPDRFFDILKSPDQIQLKSLIQSFESLGEIHEVLPLSEWPADGEVYYHLMSQIKDSNSSLLFFGTIPIDTLCSAFSSLDEEKKRKFLSTLKNLEKHSGENKHQFNKCIYSLSLEIKSFEVWCCIKAINIYNIGNSSTPTWNHSHFIKPYQVKLSNSEKPNQLAEAKGVIREMFEDSNIPSTLKERIHIGLGFSSLDEAIKSYNPSPHSQSTDCRLF